MNKSKRVVKLNDDRALKKVKVAKLDDQIGESELPADYKEMIERWGEQAQNLLKDNVKSTEEALSVFVEVVLSRSDLKGAARTAQREFLLDMLTLDEEFKGELKKVLKLK